MIDALETQEHILPSAISSILSRAERKQANSLEEKDSSTVQYLKRCTVWMCHSWPDLASKAAPRPVNQGLCLAGKSRQKWSEFPNVESGKTKMTNPIGGFESRVCRRFCPKGWVFCIQVGPGVWINGSQPNY